MVWHGISFRVPPSRRCRVQFAQSVLAIQPRSTPAQTSDYEGTANCDASTCQSSHLRTPRAQSREPGAQPPMLLLWLLR